MARSTDPRRLGPLVDQVLAFASELASGSDGLTARDEKRLSELAKQARGDKGLTAGERTQILRLAYKAVPEERIGDLKRFVAERRKAGAAKPARPRLKK